MKIYLLLMLSLFITVSSQASSYEIRSKKDRTPIFARATEANLFLKKQNIKSIAEIGDQNIQNIYFLSEINGVYKVSFLNKEKGSTSIGFVHSDLAHKVMIGEKKIVRTPRNANQTAIFFKQELLTSLREKFSLNTITELKIFLGDLPTTISNYEKLLTEKDGLLSKQTTLINQKDQSLLDSQKSLSKLTKTKEDLDQSLLTSLDDNSQLRIAKGALELDQTEKEKKIFELRTKIKSLKAKELKDRDEAQNMLYIAAAVALIFGFIMSMIIRR